MIEKFAVLVMIISFVALVWNSRKQLFLAGMLLLPILSFASVIDCDRTVQDYASVLGNRGVAVADASGALVNQGIDPRIVTVSTDIMRQYSNNLDLVEKAMESNCASWRGASNNRKSTLIVLMVAPIEHKLGVYYGAAWHSALDDHWNRIKTDYIAPRFKDGDFVGGLIAGEQQLAARVKASKDESSKGTTIVNEASKPADLSGLWSFFKWLLFIVCGGFVVLIIYRLIEHIRQHRQDIIDAQATAVMARNMAAKGISEFEQDVTDWTAQGEIVLPLASSFLDRASREYARLGDSVSTDPDTNGLGKPAYDAIARQYNDIGQLITKARLVMANFSSKKEEKNIEEPQAKESEREYPKAQPYIPPTPPVSAPTPTYTPYSNDVVIINQQSTYVEPEHYHHHIQEDDEQPTSHESSSGGSSSWSSSGSSDDSGGSSSYDSGSSDSGGGSSDF